MGWKHYQTVDPRKREPLVARGLFGTDPSTNSSLQISIFQIHQIFNISYFPQFNLSIEKKYRLFPKMPQNHPKMYTNRKTVVNEISREI